eukprot:291503_1
MMLKLATLATILGIAASSSCTEGDWTIAYNPGECDFENGKMTIKCPDKNSAGTCGDRMQSNPHLGAGYYTANIQSAPGSGTDTSLYLYTYGRNNNQDQPWNEIDIEILGQQVNGGQSKIWTNLWTGFKQQHGQYITLPYDISQSGHQSAIQVAGTSSNRTIYWIFDGAVYRWMYYGNFGDVVSTVDGKNFQANIVLWGSADDSWSDMGQLSWNSNNFPIYAFFDNIHLNQGINYPLPDTFASGVDRPNWGEIYKYPNKTHGSNLDKMMSLPKHLWRKWRK